MRTTKKSLFVILVVMMLAVSVLAGCKGDDSSSTTDSQADSSVQQSSEPVTITFSNFSGSGDNQVHLDAMIAAFEEQNPGIKVECETIGFGEYFTQMQTRIAAGTAPDCYELNYENFVPYASKGVLMGMEEMYAETGFDPSAINEQALAAFQVDGAQYGLPASFSDVLLFYNKELFDQAGIDYPTNDWTWADEQVAAEAIRALGDDIYGIFHPIHFWEFYKVVQQNGGSILNEDKSAFTLNTPQNVETLQFMVDRVQKSNVMPSEEQLAGMGDWDLFKAGRLGMIVTGIWAFPDFISNMEYDWDVAMEPGNTAKATHFFSNGLVINADSKNAIAAMKWVQFMSASKEAATIRVEAGWELPAVTDQDVLDLYMSQEVPANREVVFETLDYLVTPPIIEQFSEMADIVGLHLSAAASGEKTPEQALADAQAELEARITLN